MRRGTWGCLSLLLLLAAPAQAQPLAPKLLPLGAKLDVGHEVLKCFNLPEWKLALELDDELFRSRKKIVLLEEKGELQLEEASHLEMLRLSITGDLALATDEVKTMTAKWEKENLARHQAEESRDWWYGMALVSAGVAALTGAVLAAVLATGLK
jgi:hypothetical protein